MGEITNLSDFENQNQNQICTKIIILKSKSNHHKVADLNDLDFLITILILKTRFDFENPNHTHLCLSNNWATD